MTASGAPPAPVLVLCARCGSESPLGKRFCGDCGAPLSEADHGRSREERRRLTVLFSDLVGSTEIAASLDPEDWRGVAARYQSAAAGAVARFGGHVAQFLGDGLVAYFGWPSAYEDNGERGVRAGLAIIEAIAGLNASLALEGAVRLSVRVGIDSGPVVVGPGPAGETHVFGDAPNIAGRVQSLAPPDTILITESVRELVGGRFILTDLGEHALKGLGRPVRLHRVVSSADLSRNGARSAPRRRGRFVGRQDELHRLDEALAHARQGRGRAVVISGEAGIGKSRLMEEFHVRMRGSGAFWLDGRGERHFENTPFHPVTRILEEVLAWDQGPGPDRRLPRLERFVTDAGN